MRGALPLLQACLCGLGLTATACVHEHPHATRALAEEGAALTYDERESHCARPEMGRDGPYRMPLAGPVEDPESLAYLGGFPREARRTAQAAGLEPLLVALLREKERSGEEPTPGLLAMRQELTMRLEAFETQLSGAAFEVHCTAGQVGDVLAELDHREHARQFGLAVASILVGAVTGVAAGAWALADSDSPGSAIVGIAGSAATAGLGVVALGRQDPTVRLTHEHNLLAPIWEGADPNHLYSSFVFHMLTLPDGSEEGSPRASILHAWSQSLDEAGAPSRSIAERTLYGAGGDYSAALLQARQEQFTRLEASLQAIARDLELLDRFVVNRIFSEPAR